MRSRPRCSSVLWPRWPPVARTCRTSPSTRTCAARRSSTDHRSARPVVEGTVARGQLYADATFRTGKQNGQPVGDAADAALARAPGARPRPLPHLLHALPRNDGRRAGHRRAARLPPAAELQHRPPAGLAGRLLLRRPDQRLRRDDGLRVADPGGRPLGHRGVRPRPAALAEHDARRRSARGAPHARQPGGRAQGALPFPPAPTTGARRFRSRKSSRTRRRRIRRSTERGVEDGSRPAGGQARIREGDADRRRPRPRDLHPRADGQARHVLPLVPAGLRLLERPGGGLARRPHAPVPDGRRLGHRDPPAPRGGRAHAAALRALLRAGDLRDAPPLRVDPRRRGRAGRAPAEEDVLPERALLPGARRRSRTPCGSCWRIS